MPRIGTVITDPQPLTQNGWTTIAEITVPVTDVSDNIVLLQAWVSLNLGVAYWTGFSAGRITVDGNTVWQVGNPGAPGSDGETAKPGRAAWGWVVPDLAVGDHDATVDVYWDYHDDYGPDTAQVLYAAFAGVTLMETAA